MKKNGRFLLALALALVLALTLVTGCTPKKTSTPTPAPSSSTLEKRIAALETIVNSLDASGGIDTSIISGLQNDVSNLKSSVSGLSSQGHLTIEDIKAALEGELSVDINVDVPAYAMVTALRRKSVDITVYGVTGQLVALVLYGTGLEKEMVEPDDDDVAEIAGEYLHFTYSLTSTPNLLATDKSVPFHIETDTGLPEVEEGSPPPNAHTHPVVVDGVITFHDDYFIYTLVPNGVQLIVILDSVDPWEDGQVIRLDLGDLTGVDFASAFVLSEE